MSKHDPMDSLVVAVSTPGSGPLRPLSRGPLDLAGWTNLDCFNVSDGRRMLRLVRCESFFEIVGFTKTTPSTAQRATELIDHETLRRRFSPLIQQIRAPITVDVDGLPVRCYEHTVITKYCKAVLDVRRQRLAAGDVFHQHADCCERFLSAAADVGLAALIDEATGYTLEKQKTEYRDLFRDYIRAEMREWEKEFPDQFFDGIYKIYHLRREPKKNHPRFFAKFIRKYVYHPLADSNGVILALLDEKNPIVGNSRKHKLHQFLHENVGLQKLRFHLGMITGILGSSNSKAAFKKGFMSAFPRAYDQLELDLDDI